MPGVSTSGLVDLLNSTFEKAPKRKLEETQKLTDYVGVRNFFSNGKYDVKGGTSFRTNIRRTVTNTARRVRPYEVTSFQKTDVTALIETPWAFYQEKCVLDSKEVDMNSDDMGTQIVNIVRPLESNCMESLYNLLEADVWKAPLSSTDTLSMRGIVGYWFAPLGSGVTDTTGGFNGTTAVFRDGTTSSTIGGQDRANVANDRIRNYVGTWSGTFDQTLLSQIRRAMTRTGFQMLSELNESPVKTGGKKYMYAGHEVCDAAEDLVNKGPDDLGGQLMRFKDPGLRGVPLMRAPELSSISYNPIVAVDHSKVFGIVLRGKWMDRTEPLRVDSTIAGWSYETTCNIHCTNIRNAGWMLHTVR